MLFVVFRLGEDRYALNSREVVEVLPLVRIGRVPGAPPAIAGIILYRGVPVPVLDLKQLLTGSPSDYRAGTRVLIVDHRDMAGSTRRLGLIAERCTETLRREPADFVSSGIVAPSHTARRVAVDGQGLIQQLDLETLIPAELAAHLHQDVEG